MMYVSQIIMLYPLKLHSTRCQSYLNKTGRKQSKTKPQRVQNKLVSFFWSLPLLLNSKICRRHYVPNHLAKTLSVIISHERLQPQLVNHNGTTKLEYFFPVKWLPHPTPHHVEILLYVTEQIITKPPHQGSYKGNRRGLVERWMIAWRGGYWQNHRWGGSCAN